MVILGAGYDSRALRFAHELKGMRVFEVDHPGTQARKMGILLRSIYHRFVLRSVAWRGRSFDATKADF